MSNEKLLAYEKEVAKLPAIQEHHNLPVTSILEAFEEERKKRLYVPPYARVKLACKFFNNGRIVGHKPFFSYDYDPRENLKRHDPSRILDEGRAIRELIELANDWNNKELMSVASLYVNITETTWTGCREYNIAIREWGRGKPTLKRDYKLLELDREVVQHKPVFARIESLIDIDTLAYQYKDTPKFTKAERYSQRGY